MRAGDLRHALEAQLAALDRATLNRSGV
jgi:hypothetical protein